MFSCTDRHLMNLPFSSSSSDLKSLLHFSNLPTIVHMEMKLCAHVYFIVSMTTVNKKCPQALFPITTSSILKLAHHTMRGGETWYAYVFQSFHDDHEQQMASGTFSYNYFFTSQTCNHEMHGSETWCARVFSISMTTINK